MSIKQADEGLARYYKFQGVDDYNEKFQEWCDENGLDSDAIEAEFEEDPNASLLLDFDQHFPLQKIENKAEQNLKIIAVIKECFTDPKAYTDADEMKVQIPTFDANKNPNLFNISKQDIQKCVQKYKEQCPVIFNSEMENDRSFITVLAVGDTQHFEYIQCVVSDYFRAAIKYNLEHTNPLTVADYTKQSPHFQKLKSLSKNNNNEAPVEIVQAAVAAFSHRVCPKLMLQPLKLIEDSLERTANYVSYAAQWVHRLANTDQINTCPFQFDLCFAFPSTKEIEGKCNFAMDDEDDDEDGVEEKREDQNEFFDCIGDIEGKLKQNGLKYVMGTTDKEKMNRIFGNTFNEFRDKNTLAKDYPFHKRLVSFVDRRIISEESDTIFMYEPPANARIIPNNPVPEWFLSSTRTCILPNMEYSSVEAESGKREDQNTNKETENINCMTHCNGALLTFSFHAKESDNIKCYMYLNGQITRFFPCDIKDVLPIFFDKDWNDEENRLFVENENAMTGLMGAMKGTLPDRTFNKFSKQK